MSEFRFDSMDKLAEELDDVNFLLIGTPSEVLGSISEDGRKIDLV